MNIVQENVNNAGISNSAYIVESIKIVNNARISNSAYIVESINLWHGILGHANITSIKRLRKMEINSFDKN